jgi:transposase InsO family protein
MRASESLESRRKTASLLQPRRWKLTTDSKHDFPVNENPLDRNFSKMTRTSLAGRYHLRHHSGRLAVLPQLRSVDLFSRKIVGWNTELIHIDRFLTLTALESASDDSSARAKWLIHHSDRLWSCQ